jgi:hypothetical protein
MNVYFLGANLTHEEIAFALNRDINCIKNGLIDINAQM